MVEPITCPMCQGAIPGKEIHTRTSCPSCGADLSALVRQRLAAEARAMAPPPQPNPLISQAGLLSLVAPCFGIVVYLFGRRAFTENPNGMLVVGAVCTLVVAAGFVFGVVAFFAPKAQEAGTMGKAIAGIFINGLLISLAILNIFTHQKVAATGSDTPEPPRRGSSYISGK